MKVARPRLLSPVLLLALTMLAFRFGPDGTTWFWTTQPIVAIVLGATAGVLLALMFVPSRRHSAS